MPKLLKVELSPEQRAELRRRLHERDLAPHTRMRLECLRLSDNDGAAGRGPIGGAPSRRPQGDQTLHGRRLCGVGRRPALRPSAAAAASRPGRVRDDAGRLHQRWAELDGPTAGRLAAGPAGRAHLPRTADRAVARRRVSLETDPGHPAAQGRSRRPAGRPGPAGGGAALQQQADAAQIEVSYLDESGFVPTMPTGCTWARASAR